MQVAHGDPPERLAAVRLDDASRRGAGLPSKAATLVNAAAATATTAARVVSASVRFDAAPR